MSGDHYCAYCEHEFVVEGGVDRPACPRCGQAEAVRSADPFGLVRDIWRQWLVVLVILLLSGIGFVLYQWTGGD